jgi:glucose-6-phosphate isomerase
MAVHHSLDLAMEAMIGAGGIPAAEFDAALAAVAPALERLKDDAAQHRLALLDLPAETRDLPAVAAAAARLTGAGATDIVLLGTGGSSLGGQTLAQLRDYGVPGLGALAAPPRVHFMDNLDPRTYAAVLRRLPLHATRFVAISKSGGTGETLMQCIAMLETLQRAGLGPRIPELVMGLSEPSKSGKVNALRALLEGYGVPFLDHHTGVGGRYSVLSNVGLLPAAALGVDVAAIRAGAGVSLKAALAAVRPADAPAAAGAALNLAAARGGRNIAVLMGYADRLERFARWWVQLWAESIGKDGQGTQPVGALGPVDQHSQQQLYLAGPRDKLFTVITVANRGVGTPLDADLSAKAHEPGFNGRTIGDFVAAQGLAMVDTFARNGRPVRRIHVDALDEATIGELLMHFMLETILTGYAMGVDPFDQPAVEEAKLLAKAYLTDGKGT